jgi:hypothetical protein
LTLGHEVKMGSRSATNEEALAWAEEMGAQASAGTFADAAAFDWGVVDVGGIESSRYLEAMCLVWVLAGVHGGNWNQAFKLLRK